MKRKDILKFAAIETKYDGYHFRSRLEARHATFFNELGIKYYYEHEGYSLDGVAYLPDFWLPELDCFVEIKGQGPTSVEIEKVKKLAIYTGKDAYLIAGNIGPDQKIYCADAPTLWHVEKSNKHQQRVVEMTPEVRAILQIISTSELRLEVVNSELGIFPGGILHGTNTFGLELFTNSLLLAHEGLKKVTPALKQYEAELIKTLLPQEGWFYQFNDQGNDDRVESQWVECQICKTIGIGSPDYGSIACGFIHPDDAEAESTRLIAAYTAARQARFDGR